MKTNEKDEVIARIVRRSLVLVGLLVAALCFAGPSRAQSKPAPSGATTPAQAAVGNSAPVTQAAKAKPAAEPAARKSPSEGIKVHGHWIIEVKNPDGKVVTHREFENSLAGGNGSEGSNLLAGLLSGNYTPGPWAIGLYNISTPGPCSTQAGQVCFIISPKATNEVVVDNCSTSLAQVTSGTQPWCYDTLTESLPAPGSQGYFTTFSLSGAAYVDTSTTITHVLTAQTLCPASAPYAPGTAVSPATTAPSDCLANSTGLLAYNAYTSFTSAQVSVPVIAGQTVSVTVVISFSSQ